MQRCLFVMVALFVTGASAFAQQQPIPSTPPAAPAPAQPLPPIPVASDLVQQSVHEASSYILTPEEIETLKSAAAEARKAMVSPYPHGAIAKPVTRSVEVEPDSTQQPRLVRLSSGTITTLTFSDMNGSPWLVKSVSLDCNLFDDGATCGKGGPAKPQPTNIVKLQPTKDYSYGNIVVELEGLPSPVIFMLAAGQSDETDVGISVRVAGHNPNAKPSLIALDRMPQHDAAMGDFLDGVPPRGARKLIVGGGRAEAWQDHGALYVRTRLSILSPAFMDAVGSADGMHVFKYYSVVPQLLASDHGTTTSLYISGY